MRPKSIGGSGSVMKSPTSASGLRRLASASGICAVLAVDLGADVVFLAVFGAAGLLDGLLHRLQHLVAVDALVAGDRVGDLEKLGAGITGWNLHGVSRWFLRWCQ
jgi:hypothetical protein